MAAVAAPGPAHIDSAPCSRPVSSRSTTRRPAASGPRVRRCAPSWPARALDGFIVPRADRHQNEYVPPSEERLAWLTGFTGSAGTAIVLADKRRAVRRRPLHAAGARRRSTPRCSRSCTSPRRRRSTGSSRTCRRAASSATTPGCTPPTAPSGSRSACATAGATLVAGRAQSDRRDLDRPAGAAARRRSCCTICSFAGEAADATSSTRIRAEIGKLRADALVVSDPHAVAWTFNIRGADVAHTPLPLAFAIVPQEGRPALYIDGAQALQRGARRARRDRRGARARRLHRRSQGARRRATHGAARPGDRAPTRCRASSATPAARSTRGADPIALMKAVKNADRDRRRARRASCATAPR